MSKKMGTEDFQKLVKYAAAGKTITQISVLLGWSYNTIHRSVINNNIKVEKHKRRPFNSWKKAQSPDPLKKLPTKEAIDALYKTAIKKNGGFDYGGANV